MRITEFEINELTERVIGSAIEVHKVLGPGLLESTYRRCLMKELEETGLQVESEKVMPIQYKGLEIDHGYRIDLLVENSLVIELKTVEVLRDVHTAQILTYMRLGSYQIGLLLNFNVKLLKHGIKRVVL